MSYKILQKQELLQTFLGMKRKALYLYTNMTDTNCCDKLVTTDNIRHFPIKKKKKFITQLLSNFPRHDFRIIISNN